MNPLRILRDMATRPKLPPGWKPGGLDPETGAIWEAPHGPDEDDTMTPDPYNRLRRPPQAAPELLPQMQMQPAPQGMPLNYISGVGDEAGGEQQGGGMQQAGGDIGALLGQYLKKRQGASAADAKSAWEAGGSL